MHDKPEMALAFPDSHRWIAAGISHTDLLAAPSVYAQLRSWLAPVPGRTGTE
jgi:hypothetical protein